MVAPSTREVPDSNNEELKFASSLLQDQFAVVIFMTGVGTRALVQAVDRDQQYVAGPGFCGLTVLAVSVCGAQW